VTKPTVVDHLGALVSVATVSGRSVEPLTAYLAERLERLGFRIERYGHPTDSSRHNLVASKGPLGTDGMVLSGHLDVVPTEGQPWTSDPFAVTPRDGRLYGRGTADMKGFLAATVSACERLADAPLTRELVLAFTYDEEVGCLGSAELVRQLQAQGRPLPRACLIGEPTSFQVLRAHPGHSAVRVDVVGRAAHSSRPDLGVNAIEATARIVRRLERLADELRGERAHEDLLERPWVVLNTASIAGGAAVNIVPDRCTLRVGFRQLPGSSADAVFQRIAGAVRALDLGQAHVHVELERVTPSLLTPPNTELEHHLRSCGYHGGTGAASFATDGGNFALHGMDCLVFGPGDIAVAHQADEYVPERELHEAVDWMERLVLSKCCTS